MENGFESWLQDQQLNPNSSSGPLGFGPRVTIPSFGNMVAPKASVRQQPCGWFYGLPRYRQGFIPVVNSAMKYQLPVAIPNEAAAAANGAQKKFLVFDQSGDQTTLIYSSGAGMPPIRHHFSPSNNPKLQSESESHPLHDDGHMKGNDIDDSKSETQEDTEELNALLYSDEDEDEDSENEEMSTGHSPSSMTGFVEQKRQHGEEEDVASSGGPAKRRKLEDGVCIVNSIQDTASSGKSGVNWSGNGGNEEESRLKKEKMKETISLLQNLIPGGKNGKTAMMVIDEAIHYLRSLKVQAKALGLD